MNIQALIDRYYHAAYDKIWASNATVEEKLERTWAARVKAAARILKETGCVW